MARRPTMGHRDRVRVEFGLSPEVAEATYRHAKIQGLSLSEAGTRLLQLALRDEQLAAPAEQPIGASTGNDARSSLTEPEEVRRKTD